MTFTLTPIELASFEGFAGVRLGQSRLRLSRGQTSELLQELGTPLHHFARELTLVIGEVIEWSRCTKLLALEKHRSSRTEQQERRHRTKLTRPAQSIHPPTPRGVRELVMVLDEGDE